MLRRSVDRPLPSFIGSLGILANIHPEETLFIDDLKENCEAAEKLGIHTFQNVKFDDWLALRF